jgi:carbonic anhydrase/acetyltransferase-like protein (isoleucine patch superfamily)
MALYALGEFRPDLPPDGQYYIAESAEVIGKVRLKAGASVWFGSVLRGDNEWIEIGARSNVQDNSTFHTDPGFPLVIGDGSTIGHNVILHGCRVGNNTLIGMGAILLNGATVGSNCIVGAGALLTENMTVPDNSLVVGAPARRIRTVDEPTAQMIAKAAETYYARWKNYAVNLKRL